MSNDRPNQFAKVTCRSAELQLLARQAHRISNALTGVLEDCAVLR
jgi:hypothetical protein